MSYLLVVDTIDDFAGFYVTEILSEEDINNCLNIGELQVIDMINKQFLVDSNNGVLVWQKIPKVPEK